MRSTSLAFAAFIVVAHPAIAASLADLASYRSEAIDWAKRVGFTSDCTGAAPPATLEAEAEAGANLMKPGLWNRITGATLKEKEDFFKEMWTAYTAGAAQAKLSETPETCGLRKAELDLASALLSQKRIRLEAR